MSAIYNDAYEIYPDLGKIILSTQQEFIAMAVSFHNSLRILRREYEDRLNHGVRFTFITLSLNSDLALFAPQFGQTVDELRSEMQASYAALAALRARFPDQLNFYPTRRCPNYRIYISDPYSTCPHGIINFYGSATDSPNLPAFRIENFRTSSWASRYFDDALLSVSKKLRRKVFIIHGHSEAKWRELEELVRSFGLEPIVLQRQPNRGSTTIIEKFESYARECSFAIAIFTPDDWIKKGKATYFQPRPNALFEVGWFSAHLGRTGVLLLLQGRDTSTPSDLDGVIQLRFYDDVAERAMDIRKELVALELIDDG